MESNLTGGLHWVGVQPDDLEASVTLKVVESPVLIMVRETSSSFFP